MQIKIILKSKKFKEVGKSFQEVLTLNKLFSQTLV